MRLINVLTLQLKEFFDRDIPDYAILSHTWSSDELTLQDFKASWSNPESPFRQSRGYTKVVNASKAALEKGFVWLWCDTCCIDKTSSAELSEAINSMFRWYSKSGCCLVFLEDFRHHEDSPVDIGHCRWLTRGWCLQELLAPREMAFYDMVWHEFASRYDLIEQLILHTGINRRILYRLVPMSRVPVAHRLSWAAKRTTSRIEDQAYCLLGLLGINMPLLYGEGHRAFQRLQEEILRVHSDASIFLWDDGQDSGGPHVEAAEVLAPDVSCFAKSGNIEFTSNLAVPRDPPRFSLTHRGIRVRGAMLGLWNKEESQSRWHYLLPLRDLAQMVSSNSHRYIFDPSPDKRIPCLRLVKAGPGTYIRLPGWIVLSHRSKGGEFDVVNPEVDFHIVQDYGVSKVPDRNHPLPRFARLDFEKSLYDRHHVGLSVEPRAAWDSLHSRFFLDLQDGLAGYVKIHPIMPGPTGPSSESFLVALRARSPYDVPDAPDQSILSVHIIPSNIWDLYVNFNHNIAWRLELAIVHPSTTTISSPGQQVFLNVGRLRLAVLRVTHRKIPGYPEEVIKLSWSQTLSTS